MGIFVDYATEIGKVIKDVYSLYIVEDDSEAYIRGLASKFDFLRKEADAQLLKDFEDMYRPESIRELKPGKEEILLPYLKGVINLITRINMKGVRWVLITPPNGRVEAILETFGKQYTAGGDIYRLLEDVDRMFLKAWNSHGSGNPTTDVDRQLAYEFKGFVKRLPKACWPMAIESGN